MRTMMLAAMAMAAPATAQMAPAPVCTAPVAPPAAFASWVRPVSLADGGTLAIGQATTLSLGTAPVFAVPPGHAPAAGSFGGTLRFTVAVAGTYRIGLGSGVWIDVIRDGKPIASVAHDHGPACSPVRKIVDFALTPGSYALQLSGGKAASVDVMVVKGS